MSGNLTLDLVFSKSDFNETSESTGFTFTPSTTQAVEECFSFQQMMVGPQYGPDTIKLVLQQNLNSIPQKLVVRGTLDSHPAEPGSTHLPVVCKCGRGEQAEGLELEARRYTEDLKDIQGTHVPKFYGLFKLRATSPYEGTMDPANDVMCLVLSDVGRCFAPSDGIPQQAAYVLLYNLLDRDLTASLLGYWGSVP